MARFHNPVQQGNELRMKYGHFISGFSMIYYSYLWLSKFKQEQTWFSKGVLVWSVVKVDY